MKKYRLLATLLGVGLNVISGIFTVKLMWAFATSGMGKIIFAVFGVLMQATMACCAVFAVHCIFQGQSARAIPAAVVYCGLLLLSFCGTAGNLSTENANLNNAGIENSLEFKTVSGQIADIEKQAEYLRMEIDQCREKNIITRCVTPKSAELTGLLSEKKELQNRLLTVKPAIAEDEIFRRLSEFLQISTDQTKSLVFLFYSILLDIGGAVLLVYGSGLLAFQTRDLWREAEIKTEHARLDLERQSKTMIIPDKTQDRQETDTGIRQAKDTRQTDRMPLSFPVPVTAERQEKIQAKDDAPVHVHVHGTETQDRQDKDTGKIRQKIGYVQDRTQDTAQVNTGGQTGNGRQSVSQDKISQYVTALFAGQKSDGSLVGRRKIGDRLSFSQQECDKIHTSLKRKGLIRVSGQKTYPEVEKTEMLNRIAGGTA